ncbi:MAG: hypothetical protein ACFFG0_04570 [Candidatus Thorarchaeota archaeon]
MILQRNDEILKESDLGDLYVNIGNKPMLFGQKKPPAGYKKIIFKQEIKEIELKFKPKYNNVHVTSWKEKF